MQRFLKLPKNILFIHRVFPCQFEKLIMALKNKGCSIEFVCQQNYRFDHGTERHAFYPIKGVKVLKWTPSDRFFEQSDQENTGWAFEKNFTKTRNSFFNGHNFVHVLLNEFRNGRLSKPDLIYTHSTFEEALFIRELFPHVPLVTYCEFFENVDSNEDVLSHESLENGCVVRLKNKVKACSLLASDYGLSPLNFQKKSFPKDFQSKIKVIYDGVDAQKLRSHHVTPHVAPDGHILSPGQKIITYGAPTLEPVRGFPQAMEAFGKIVEQDPDVHIAIYGQDGSRYTAPHLPETHRSDVILERFVKKEHQNRLHFLGPLPYSDFVNLLHLSSVHLYLTIPLVLSWSFIEAMAIGCAIVGSKTAPVEEVIKNNENGLLAAFFDTNEIARQISRLLEDDALNRRVRKAAKETVDKNYDISVVIPEHLRWIEEIMDRHSVSSEYISQIA